nr:hypothetical protein [uncultured Oscillibacter sp.]
MAQEMESYTACTASGLKLFARKRKDTTFFCGQKGGNWTFIVESGKMKIIPNTNGFMSGGIEYGIYFLFLGFR